LITKNTRSYQHFVLHRPEAKPQINHHIAKLKYVARSA